jgi:hypothetical protein
MQTENTASTDTTTTAPAGPAAMNLPTTTTPPASGQEGAPAGQGQPNTGTTEAPANGQNADQGTQQGQQQPADGTTNPANADAERDEQGRFRSKVQKRIDELTFARHAAEREAARWRAIAEGTQKGNPAPQAHEFATDEDYAAAMQQHRIDEAARKVAANQASQAAEQYQQDAASAVDATYDQRAQEAARRIPDFVDVVSKANIPITNDMLGALKASAHGPDIVYALAKNPAEAQRISSLPPAQMFMALGAMEATAAAKVSSTAAAPAAAPASAARTTNAPPPVSTAGAAAAPPSTDPANMNQEQYEAWRREQGAKYF